MFVPILIDTNAISHDFSMDQAEVNDMMDYAVKEITASFARQWEQTAIEQLKSSRQEYISNLVVVDEGFAKGAVVLIGWLPNAIEQGIDQFDLKDGLLNGPNVKQGQNGKYNTVPFSFGAPGSLDENFSGGILPDEIHDIVKNKQLHTAPSGQQVTQGLRLEELPQQYQQTKIKKITTPEPKSFKEYQHRSAIHEGVRKIKDSVTGQSSYQSFRRVSENSDPDSWIHPGIEPHQLAQKTLSEFDVPGEMGRAVDKFLSQR